MGDKCSPHIEEPVTSLGGSFRGMHAKLKIYKKRKVAGVNLV